MLLYELLTGTTPFDIRALLASGLAELMCTIREVEPHKPSTRVSTLGDRASRMALRRHVDVRKLGTLLRGDIDRIVMKCLEKDRSGRYETANGLAADIQRHLNREPVTAGAPTASYRLRKFIRRNRLQVIAGGQDVTILAAMDNAIADIDSGRFQDDPTTEAWLKFTIATILMSNGRVQQAEAMLAQSLATQRRLHARDDRGAAQQARSRACNAAEGPHGRGTPMSCSAAELFHEAREVPRRTGPAS